MRRMMLAFVSLCAMAQCDLTTRAGLHLGPTAATRMKSTGEIKMAFVFVDFPDAPANEDAQQLYNALVPYSQQWIDEVSNGRAKLTVTPVFQWFRMPKNSGVYEYARGLTFDLHKTYITDALTVADGAFNFANFDGVYIIASRDSQVPFSTTWVPNPGQGVRFDGAEVRHVITLGRDTRQAIPEYRWHVISHETGHLMGLPDLYLYTGTDVHAPIGAWDNMGLISLGAHFTAWQKRKLGWLVGEEFACVTARSARVELSPLSTSSGVRGVAVRVSPSKAIVAEVRRKIGHDARLCEPGLLVYTVDSSIASGQGAMVAQRAVADVAGRVGACGSGYNAAFGAPKPMVFRDSASGVSFEIVSDRGDAGMTVAVTNPAGVAVPPRITAGAAAGAFGALRTIAPGGWLELFGENLSTSSRSWAGADFVDGRAPTALDGVSVTIDGQPAFVAFASPGQINVQAPSNIRLGAPVPVVVTNASGASAPLPIATAARAPGLLAPAQFSAGGKQYVAALYTDQTFVGPPNLVSGATFTPAVAGDVIVLYGVGFGATTPASPAGVAAPAGVLPNVVLKLGDVTVPLAYAGAAPGAFGLYQFNFTMPAGLSGDVPLMLTVDGVATTQALWFATK